MQNEVKHLGWLRETQILRFPLRMTPKSGDANQHGVTATMGFVL
jgi:hypothetical protein